MSNKRHKYFNKVPPFKPDPEHYTRKQHSWKAKEAYETEYMMQIEVSIACR